MTSFSTTYPNIDGMRCLACGKVHPLSDYFEGCPDCADAGSPSSVAPLYRFFPKAVNREHISQWLIYSTGAMLGEGDTPVISLPRLAAECGVAELHVKNEAANPTGSHKDRMSAMVVQRAREVGASTVVAASSGNAGASLAAYAASAGLDCVIVTTPKISSSWRRAIEMYGAELIATETPMERWQIVAQNVRAGKWYPATNYVAPPVGSNPFGVDGYRAIALELFVQSGDQQPTDLVVPTSRADVLWGIAQGYADLCEAGLLVNLPRVHAVEPFPRITRVLAGEDYRKNFPGSNQMVSIGGSTVAYQALDALRLCGGTAVAVKEADALSDQGRLARNGLYLELSSAAALTGLERLRENGTIGTNARVVLVATSHGYKETTEFVSPIAPVLPDASGKLPRATDTFKPG